MDESELQPTDRTHAAETAQTRATARALVSAGIFGVIGGAIGNWLGKRGNDAQGKMAQPIMKWGMGIFWATLAAYSSLKASQTEANARAKREMRGVPMIEGDTHALAPPNAPKETELSAIVDSEKKSPEPPTTVRADSANREGLLENSAAEAIVKK